MRQVPDRWDIPGTALNSGHQPARAQDQNYPICGHDAAKESDLPSQGLLSLKTMVHTQPVGVRPSIELEPTDHPLAIEQREGITVARV
jgi:hypothetical protein